MSWFSSFSSLFTTQKSNASSQPLDNTNQRLLEEKATPLNLKSDNSAHETSKALQKPQPAAVERPNRNKIIFGAGVAFFTFSLLITRRSFARRRLASAPGFYTNSPGHHADQSAKVSGAMEAVEALNIATINVLSVTMMAAGGSLWYLDINSMADARKLLRGGLGVDGTGRSEEQAEEEFEEWMATVLARKDAKAGKQGIDATGKGQQR